jgi:hypothetical protein
MVPALREEFNRNFTVGKYRQFLQRLDAAAGTHIDFRVSETPCFVPPSLLDRMAEDGRQLVAQLVNNPEYRRASDVTIPPEYNVPNESPLPMFVQVDFGLVRNVNGALEPKLVELQAFPSLYGYQAAAARQYVESYGLLPELGIYLSGHDEDSYWRLMRQLIVGDHDPENVILMEIDPDHQKTLPDFLITQRKLGIAIVDILSLVKRGGGSTIARKKMAARSRCGASTIAALWTSWSVKESRYPSICARRSMSNGLAILTGISASASSPFRI